MKKSFEIEELGCANCAAKIEAAIQGLDGVQSASVNFMRQTLVLEASDEYFAEVLKKSQKIVRKIEPDARLVV